jgi:hypothetical protein
MAIDFPNSPTAGDLYTAGGKTWQWNSTYWSAYGTSPVLRTSDTAPVSPNNGDLWYETDTGRFFTYIDSAWVEIGNATDIAGALQPGQVTALSAVTSLTSDDVFPVVDNPASATASNKITWGNVQSSITSTGTLGSLAVTGDITRGGVSLPRGIMAVATSSTNYTLTTTMTQTTDMSVTFTAVANRNYKITYFEPFAVTPSTASSYIVFGVFQSSTAGTQLGQAALSTPAAVSLWGAPTISVVTTFTAGSVTIIGAAVVSTTSGTPVLNRAAAGNKSLLLVEDIGAA